jgi:hypothetical protein
MVGVGDSPHISSQQANHVSALRFLFLVSSTTLLALLFAGCSATNSVGDGGNGFSESSCSYDPSSGCTDSGGTGSGTTDGGTSGGCTDAADPSCGTYDPTGGDGGGNGDGGCDPSTCGDSGDTGNGGDDGGGDPGDDGGGMGMVDSGGHAGKVTMAEKRVATKELAQSPIAALASASPRTLSALKVVGLHIASLQTHDRQIAGLLIEHTARLLRAKEDKDEIAS